MKLLATSLVLSTLALLSSASPHLPFFPVLGPNTTMYTAGDSTMMPLQGSGLAGWGAWNNFTWQASLHPVNRARGGRSLRTFTNEGLWAQLLNLTKPGDVVVIEFGHNDAGDWTVAPYRADLPGAGPETVTVNTTSTNFNGTDVVRTFPGYLRIWLDQLREKKVYPILSSRTPKNNWVAPLNITMVPATLIGVNYTEMVAGEKHVPYVDHYRYTQYQWEALGYNATQPYFPIDNTHVQMAGAKIEALGFISGILCNKRSLGGLIPLLSAEALAVKPICNPPGRRW